MQSSGKLRNPCKNTVSWGWIHTYPQMWKTAPEHPLSIQWMKSNLSHISFWFGVMIDTNDNLGGFFNLWRAARKQSMHCVRGLCLQGAWTAMGTRLGESVASDRITLEAVKEKIREDSTEAPMMPAHGF